MRFSIRYQLLVPLLTLMVGVVGMSVWTAVASANRAWRQIEHQMDAVAATVRSASFPRKHTILPLMKGMSGAEFLLGDAHGRPLRDDEDRLLTTLTAVPENLPPPARTGQPQRLGPRVTVADETYFYLGVPLGPDADADRVLYIFYPEALWRDALWQAILPGLTFGVVGSLVSILLMVYVTGRLTGRIQQLGQRTRQIAAGDFSLMPLPPHNDETRDLTRSINDMAQRLADYQDTLTQSERLRLLGQVSGGLAHQLRNSVTGAKLAVQLHERENTNGQADEILQVALRQLTLVETHLKRFLDLGKALELRKQTCDVLELVEEATHLVGPQCRHAGIQLELKLPASGDLRLQADPQQLSHLLLNLITNAMEAAGPGGRVGVMVALETTDRVVIEVLDSGPGPPAAIAAKLFEPFVTGKPEGVGLGLAVARQVAEAHHGALTWSRRGADTCFRLELPLEARAGSS